jgi:hypothetical protein
MRTITWIAAAALLIGHAVAAGEGALTPEEKRAGWVPIFDGKTLSGWHVSSKTGHGTGGRWVVANGAIVGGQDPPGNGGIVITDKSFGDFEVAVEMNNDYGPDSGLFLRSTEDGRCYQAMIDYHNDGNLMGVYGEGIGGFAARNFQTLEAPDRIKVLDYPPFPCPFTPEGWKKLWKRGEWNDLRARITGNPPTIETWINGVRIMDWTDKDKDKDKDKEKDKEKEKRLPDRGAIGLQVHGGAMGASGVVRYRNIRVKEIPPDNTLSPQEKAAGWILLFDGKSLNGWTTDKKEPSKVPVEDGCINPHKCGGYMMIHEKQWGDLVLSLDFRISKGCNSGVFVRTYPLTPVPGWDVGYNGIEMQVLDSTTAGMHDTGAIYDLVKPAKNAMNPAGQWNHAVITCDRNIITVELNGEKVTRMDLDEWTEPGKRPDGSEHKFTGLVFKERPRRGYIGLQDHGSPCWYKNIKLLPLHTRGAGDAPAAGEGR